MTAFPFIERQYFDVKEDSLFIFSLIFPIDSIISYFFAFSLFSNSGFSFSAFLLVSLFLKKIWPCRSLYLYFRLFDTVESKQINSLYIQVCLGLDSTRTLPYRCVHFLTKAQVGLDLKMLQFLPYLSKTGLNGTIGAQNVSLVCKRFQWQVPLVQRYQWYRWYTKRYQWYHQGTRNIKGTIGIQGVL